MRTTRRGRFLRVVLWGAIIALGGASTVHARKDSFYSNKTARMILGFTPGRPYALGENAVALHANYIPATHPSESEFCEPKPGQETHAGRRAQGLMKELADQPSDVIDRVKRVLAD